MAGAFLWGWDTVNSVWVKVLVNSLGEVKTVAVIDHLDDIGDVSVAAPTDQYLLYWDAAMSLWKCKALTDSDIPAAIARDAEVTSAISTHAGKTTGVHSFNKSCRVYWAAASQSIPDITSTILNFDTELWDTDGIWNAGANSSKLICVTAGKYLCIAGGYFEPNATGTREFAIQKNDVVIALAAPATNPSGAHHMTVSTIIELAVNDYIQFWVKQTSGVALLFATQVPFSPSLMIARLP